MENFKEIDEYFLTRGELFFSPILVHVHLHSFLIDSNNFFQLWNLEAVSSTNSMKMLQFSRSLMRDSQVLHTLFLFF